MKMSLIISALVAFTITTSIAAEELDPGNESVILALRTQVVKLENQLSETKAELSQTRAQLGELLPYIEKARTLPIKIEMRKAMTDNTIVLKIAEQQQALPVKITFSNATFGAKSFDRILQPCSAWTEIGTLEGWKGQMGDSVYISSAGYDIKAGNLH